MNSKIQKFVRVSGPKKMPKNLKLTRKSQEFIWKSMKKMLKNQKNCYFYGFFSTQILFGKSQ